VELGDPFKYTPMVGNDFDAGKNRKDSKKDLHDHQQKRQPFCFRK
jgi:FAD synthase